MKVILLMADGMRHDAVEHIPEVQEMMKQSTYTLRATSVMPTITLPCHLSLFLSVDPERHGTTTNVYAPQVRPIDGLCEKLNQAGKKCAFFYNWEEFRDLSRPGSLTYYKMVAGEKEGFAKSTYALTEDAISYIRENQPDFVFYYTGLPDDAGHTHSWMSPEYIEAVETSWKEFKRIIDTLSDEYTIVITTDHGGHGRSHGTDMPEDMLIPLFIKGPDFAEGKEFEQDVNIKDIAPTIAALLGAESAQEWEGKVLYDHQ
ncbi:MAG: hypothetical protein E7418_03830 [Ruminococcaceae bacterium]|nr:hypothetical protein [Oscillospiraceae bacterium]